MRVYKVVEFDKKELNEVTLVQYLVNIMEKYSLSDEAEIYGWPTFTENLDKLRKYIEDHQEAN